jgi:hypothetical protein
MLETIDFEWIQKEDKKEKSLLQQFVLYSANTMTGFPRLPLLWCSQGSGPGDIRFCSEMGDVFQA